MNFTNGSANGVFLPEDLEVMQKAYELTCVKLNVCPQTYERKNHIARLVMRIFCKGENNPHTIALQTVDLEALYSSLKVVD